MTNPEPISRDVADTRHHSRLKIPSLSVVIGEKSYPIIDLSLSGCGIKTVKNFSKDLDETVSVKFSMVAFGEGNYLILQATIVKEPDENDHAGLSFTALSGGEKEILRYILTVSKQGREPDPKKIASLFKKKEENDSLIVHVVVNADQRSWVKYFPWVVFALLFSLVIFIAVKNIFFPSSEIMLAERAIFVTERKQDFNLPEAGVVTSLVSVGMKSVARGQPLVRYVSQEGEETKILPSPCDCFIIERAVTDEKSIHPAGFRLFSLAQTGAPILIEAYVPAETMHLLYVGMKAEASVPMHREKIPGLITDILQGVEDGRSRGIIKIRPDTLVPVHMVGKESKVQFLF